LLELLGISEQREQGNNDNEITEAGIWNSGLRTMKTKPKIEVASTKDMRATNRKYCMIKNSLNNISARRLLSRIQQSHVFLKNCFD
jgi:hypothetical protein